MSTETLIRISPDTVEVAVEQLTDGVVSRKLVTPESLARCFLQSKFDSEVYHTGLLPDGCIATTVSASETVYFIRHSQLRSDITYYGTEYPNFPLPRLIFAFRYRHEEHKVTGSRMCVVQDTRITLDMPTYTYPFSNVSDPAGDICLGNNALPIYKDPTRLSTLPDYILRMPNNNDGFFNNRNKPKLEYRDLLELLKDKEPSYYYSDILIPNNRTLKEFIYGR